MSRIRTLKPEFFRSRSLARIPIAARLTFQGLWCEADDFGRGIADPRLVKGAVWPLDDDIDHNIVAEHLEDLAVSGHIRLYVIGDDRYYEIPSWEEHQAAAYRRGKSQYPEPPEHEPHDQSCKDVQAAPPVVLELGTGNEELGTRNGTGNAPAKRPRAADPIWEAILDCWAIDQSELTKPERDRLNKVTKVLREIGAAPDEIPRRRARYRVRYRDAADTPMAIAGRWAELATDDGQQPRMPDGFDSIQRAVAAQKGRQ